MHIPPFSTPEPGDCMHAKVRILIWITIANSWFTLNATMWQDQPVVSCFFPRPYTPRQLPGNSHWPGFAPSAAALCAMARPVCTNSPICDSYNEVPAKPSEEESIRRLVRRSLGEVGSLSEDGWFSQLELGVAQTFRPERITQCLFGGGVENCFQTLCVSGSQTSGRGSRTVVLKEHHRSTDNCHMPITQRVPFSVDWLADYFWLPTDFVSELRFKPTINTYRVTPSLHGAYLLNECTALEAEIYLPVEHATWNLHTAERIRKNGANADAAGYFSAEPIERDILEPSARHFFAGNAPEIANVLIAPLKYAKFAPCAQHKTALNCAYMKLGVYSTPGEWVLYGLGAILSAPAGTVPTGDYLFEPLVGDGHYWRYGVEAYAQFHLFNDAVRESWGLLTFESTITSCAPSHQRRTFDLCNKPSSRYMLIHKPSELVPTYSYVANISTLDVKVHIDVLFEISTTLTYATECSNWSFGYRFWARSDDRIRIPCPNQFPSNTWALKGDASVYGFAIPPGALPAGTPVRMPASESNATIEAGTNMPAQGSTDQAAIAVARRNPRIDEPVFASLLRQGSGGQAQDGENLAASPTDLTLANQVNKSEPPKLLTINDLNIKSACSTGMLHTIFTILDMQLNELHSEVALHMYLRGEIDCGKASNAVPPAYFDQCVNIAPSQWEVAFGLYIDF